MIWPLPRGEQDVGLEGIFIEAIDTSANLFK
jgi:hypothetical protein